jgi:hypothetical protein
VLLTVQPPTLATVEALDPKAVVVGFSSRIASLRSCARCGTAGSRASRSS